MIVVLDCNIWISLTINDQLDFIADISDNGIFIASFTELKVEISSVLTRPKILRFSSSLNINRIMELHDLVTTKYKIGKKSPVTGDVKDDYLFALCAKCKADYFITGDKLLLKVIKYKNTEIIPLSHFKELIKLFTASKTQKSHSAPGA